MQALLEYLYLTQRITEQIEARTLYTYQKLN